MRKINIDSLKPGMFVHGLSKGDGVSEEIFQNTIKLKDAGEIESFKEKGYLYAYVHVSKDPPPPLKTDDMPLQNTDITNYQVAGKKVPLFSDDEEVLETIIDFFGEEEALEVVRSMSLARETENFSSLPDEEGATEDDPVGFNEEIKRANHIKEMTEVIIADTLEDARLGKSIDPSPVKKVVTEMVDSLFRNRDAMLSLASLKDHDNYTFGHSINVSILSMALGKTVGLGEDELNMLGLGAMLHDIGKMRVDQEILNKPERLTEEEFMQMQEHTILGAMFLAETTGVCDEVMQIAREHHESYDGSGYPDGLAGDQIDLHSHIVSIADFYDALTTDRSYRSGQDPTSILRGMFRLKGVKFDPVLMEKFIRCLGIYPIGSFVKLNTGETAVVKSIDRHNLMHPTVIIFLDKAGEKICPPQKVAIDGSGNRKIISTKPENKCMDDMSREFLGL